MAHKKEVALQVERFHDDEDLEFRIPSKKEMLSVLQHIAEKNTRIALYYDGHHNFILTTLLGANGDGMWLDVGPFPPENKRILLSDNITFVSMHQHVKVQFVSHQIENVSLDGNETFFIPLPAYLLRIQRRDYFRLSVPISTPVKCTIPIKPGNPDKPDEPAVMREVIALDISGGGIGLLCGEHESELIKGKTFQDCQVSLPDIGVINVTIAVRSNIKFTALNDAVNIHAGCQFINLNNQAHSLLQRYITRLQAEALAKT